MIIVCKGLEDRLDKLWYKLQTAVFNAGTTSPSQYELDEECVDVLETMVDGFVAANQPPTPDAYGTCALCFEERHLRRVRTVDDTGIYTINICQQCEEGENDETT